MRLSDVDKDYMLLKENAGRDLNTQEISNLFASVIQTIKTDPLSANRTLLGKAKDLIFKPQNKPPQPGTPPQPAGATSPAGATPPAGTPPQPGTPLTFAQRSAAARATAPRPSRSLEEGILDKITYQDLIKQWQKFGSPSDSNEIANMLRATGVGQPQIKEIYTKENLPAPSFSTATPTGGGATGSGSYSGGSGGGSGGSGAGRRSGYSGGGGDGGGVQYETPIGETITKYIRDYSTAEQVTNDLFDAIDASLSDAGKQQIYLYMAQLLEQQLKSLKQKPVTPTSTAAPPTAAPPTA